MKIDPLPVPDPDVPKPHWEQLAAIFYHSTDGMFVINSQMRIILYNPTAAEMTGWAGKDAIEVGCRVLGGKACPIPRESLFNPAECPGSTVLLGLRASYTHDVILVDRQGKKRRVEVTYSPVREEGGGFRFILGTLRDVEEKRELEDQLLQSKKLASLGTLVAGIAHELRNPLGIIRSAGQILANEERTAPQKREAVQLILEESKRLDNSIREFLAFARPRRPNLERVSIGDLIERVVTLHTTNADSNLVDIEVESQPTMPPALVDPDLIRQVFENLLTNAEQSVGETGDTIRVRVRAMEVDRHIRIDFTDNGSGIDKESLERIYDPFFTTKREGTGLGLSIVMQIITDHRGRLSVQSQPGKGTTFTVLLPIAEELPQ